jgi:hypothetical protein
VAVNGRVYWITDDLKFATYASGNLQAVEFPYASRFTQPLQSNIRATSFSMRQNGETLVVFNMDSMTFCFNTASEQWCEWTDVPFKNAVACTIADGGSSEYLASDSLGALYLLGDSTTEGAAKVGVTSSVATVPLAFASPKRKRARWITVQTEHHDAGDLTLNWENGDGSAHSSIRALDTEGLAKSSLVRYGPGGIFVKRSFELTTDVPCGLSDLQIELEPLE